MGRQAEHYHEEASYKLTILTRLASFAVWGFVAILIIIFIFRMVFMYLNVLDNAGSSDLSKPLY